MPLNDYHEACWKEINLGWEERVTRMCRETERSPAENRLVEGIFRHDDLPISIFVLIRFGYDGGAPEGRRYKVEESLWRTG